MDIRPGTNADIPSLIDLNRVVQQLHAAAEPDYFKPSGNETELAAFFQEQLAKPAVHIFLAEVAEQPVGYLFATVDEHEQNPFSHAQRVVHIHHLAVASGHRRQGIGTGLMARAQQLAHDVSADRLVLGTWAFNRGARAFFASLGYRIFSFRMWRRP
ncbi:MAG: GNAT family N-acetyltransferase [Candidatus Promineifilaceae bacterium]|nr:GNAT family N-acetyltransferase [Candidatus Promineifilaceae bacterium]